MARPKQSEMFDQKRVPAIERWADKFQEKRELIGNLEDEMENAEFKLGEAMHSNADALDRQEGPKGEKWLVYDRGDYKIVIKEGKERINVKIRDRSKGDAGGEPEAEGESE